MAYFSTRNSSRPFTATEKLLRIHWPVLLATCLLAAIGTATLYSVSGGSFQPWAERHTLRFLVALAIVVAMALVRLEVWIKLSYPAYAIALLMLALVPLFGVEALGAKRWVEIRSAVVPAVRIHEVRSRRGSRTLLFMAADGARRTMAVRAAARRHGACAGPPDAETAGSRLGDGLSRLGTGADVSRRRAARVFRSRRRFGLCRAACRLVGIARLSTP